MTRKEALQIVMETIQLCDLSIFNEEQRDKIKKALEITKHMREKLTKS